METIRGKTSHTLDLTELHARLANYNRITLDLGTGDGKFAFCHAENFPTTFVIGVDSCRENLRRILACQPAEPALHHCQRAEPAARTAWTVSHITINFPWGSLLESLLHGDPLLMRGLETILTSARFAGCPSERRRTCRTRLVA
jgi:16S rRNA (adenine(1408)-N(1))-methyltransferase